MTTDKRTHINLGSCPGAGNNKRGVSTDGRRCAACRASAEVWGILGPHGGLFPETVRRTQRQAWEWMTIERRELEKQGYRAVKLFVQPVDAVREVPDER